mmetsp:Transcript_23667/g.21035  ORF Transcript_23667/g.21035 Transcript_23667/m.21035 type:complete len:109 (+) Transcript_23667:34-360(+)
MSLHPNQDKHHFPVTRVVVRKTPVPISSLEEGYIRFKSFERPLRIYKSWPYYTRAFLKTAVLGFTLISVTYFPGYFLICINLKNQILSRMPAGTDYESIQTHRKGKQK